jgi:hypothetical protein
MDCSRAAEILVRRIYRETTPDEERELFEHLSVCSACREMDQDYWAIARILDREQPEPSLGSAGGKSRNSWNRWRRYAPALAAACILAAVITVQGISIQVGSWGFHLGASPVTLDRDEIQKLVRAEMEDSPTMTLSLTQLRQAVSRQNEMLAFLAGAQQRSQVLTARTFDEMERQMRSMWLQGGDGASPVLPASMIYEPETGDWPEEEIIRK